MPSGMDDYFASGSANPRRNRRDQTPQQTTPEKQETKVLVETQPVQTPRQVATVTPSIVKSTSETQIKRYQAQPKEGRKYPDRTFDTYASKMIQIEDSDLAEIRGIADLIKVARRGRVANTGQAKQRITENVILRNLISVFCEEYQEAGENIDFSSIDNEEDVRNLIRNIIKF